jgi:Rrf2 family protein
MTESRRAGEAAVRSTGEAAVASTVKLTARADYAVRALVTLAKEDRTLSAAAIAGPQGIPLKFLLSVLRDLTHDGLLTSRRGPAGGYRLARDPSLITLAEIIASADARHCIASTAEPGPHPAPQTGLAQVWLRLLHTVGTVLGNVTLEHLVHAEATG